ARARSARAGAAPFPLDAAGPIAVPVLLRPPPRGGAGRSVPVQQLPVALDALPGVRLLGGGLQGGRGVLGPGHLRRAALGVEPGVVELAEVLAGDLLRQRDELLDGPVAVRVLLLPGPGQLAERVDADLGAQ